MISKMLVRSNLKPRGRSRERYPHPSLIVSVFKKNVYSHFQVHILNNALKLSQRLDGVLDSVFILSSVVGRRFKPRSGQTRDCKIGMSYFFANYSGFLT